MSEETKGSISADISEEAIAAAVAAVERNQAAPAEVVLDGPVEAAVEVAAAELAAARDELARAQEDQTKLRGELEEAQGRLLRTAADLENARKRAHREKEELKKFAAERLLKDLAPVLDNLDRALAAAAAEDPLSSGVRMVRKSFEDVLARHGVHVFSALGEPFDPRLHEALLQVESDAAPGTVVAEHGRGFLLEERLLRPAMVGVAVARPAAPEPPPAAAAAPAPEAQAEPGGPADSGAGQP